jgi:hypothetical protein
LITAPEDFDMATADTSFAQSAVAGVAAGTAATIAMSALMLPASRLGLMGTQPPRRMIDEAADRAPTAETPDEAMRDLGASLLHLAIGAGAGLAFVLGRQAVVRLTGRRPPSVASGASFGLALWALNYTALAPSLDILPPAHEDRAGRQPTLIVAHIVYGVCCALIAERLIRPSAEPS